jgi:hypothetical protein
VPDGDSDDLANTLVDLTDYPIVADSITMVSGEVFRQRLSLLSRILGIGNIFIQVFLNPLLGVLVKFGKLLIRFLAERESVTHRSPSSS